MSTQQEQPRQPAPSEQPSAEELRQKQEELAFEVAEHLAKLRGEGKQ